MALKVIGSGFGRTGTMSLKMALDQLGVGPCHHMEEVIDHPEQLAGWRAAALGEAVNWDEIFNGYRSTVDWPGAHYWRELVEYYPDAKVVHTTRSRESWWASYSKTIAMILSEAGAGDTNHEIRSMPEMAHAIIADQTFKSHCQDQEAALAAFDKRNKEVVETIPADRLLVFEVKQGWEPLCNFLDVPVPDGPFPRRNDQAEFFELVQKIDE